MHRTALAALIAAGSLAATANAATPATMTAEGTCEQVGAVVLVDTARLRPYVPAGFPIASFLGRSPLMVTGGRCDPHSVDHRRSAPNTFGLVLALASHPDNPLDTNAHAYDLWWQNSERRTAEGYRRMGIRSERARGLAVSSNAGSWVFDASRAHRFPAQVEVELGADVPGPALELTTHHWHDGRHGRVLIDPLHTGFGLDAGLGRVSAPAGSPLAEILGGRTATGAGGVLRFSFTGSYGPA